MKAFVYKKYGPPDVLKLKDLPVPVPGKGEVLVKTEAVSLNTSDYELLTGKPVFTRVFGLFKPGIKILGSDIAGTAEKAGENVKNFKPGDEIYGDIFESFGGFAEYVSVPEKMLTKKPPGMSFITASAVPQSSAIALQGLCSKREIKKGDKVLINGAGGGAGSFAVQLAKYYGAEVTGIDSSIKIEFIKSLGSDKAIDYIKEKFSEQNEKYDLILDLAAYNNFNDYRKALKPDGIYLMAGGSMRMIFQLLFKAPFISMMSGKKMSLLALKTNYRIEEISALILDKKIRAEIDRIYSFQEIPEALGYLGNKSAKGKIVINMTQDQ